MTARPAELSPSSRGRRSAGAEQYRHIADSAPVMIWAAGPDRRCTYLNHRWLEFTGRPIEEHLGDRWLDCVHADDRAACVAAYAEAFAHARAFEVEFWLRRGAG